MAGICWADLKEGKRTASALQPSTNAGGRTNSGWICRSARRAEGRKLPLHFLGAAPRAGVRPVALLQDQLLEHLATLLAGIFKNGHIDPGLLLGLFTACRVARRPRAGTRRSGESRETRDAWKDNEIDDQEGEKNQNPVHSIYYTAAAGGFAKGREALSSISAACARQ